ncbi:MAG: PfkB family carbohydrate kinase, partial [Sphaerochaetaceae bacterium]
DKSVLDLPLHLIDLLSVNETEAQSLCGSDKIDEILVTLKERYPKTAVLLTLGNRGAIWSKGEQMFSYGNYNVPVVDTTGAGDTFIGYFLAAMVSGKSNYDSLKLASMAANVAITKKGAMDSIPRIEELSLLDLYGYIEF